MGVHKIEFLFSFSFCDHDIEIAEVTSAVTPKKWLLSVSSMKCWGGGDDRFIFVEHSDYAFSSACFDFVQKLILKQYWTVKLPNAL